MSKLYKQVGQASGLRRTSRPPRGGSETRRRTESCPISRTAVFNIAFLLLCASAFGQPTAASPQQRPTRIEITLERQDGKVWKAVDPTLVLASGDVVRFRFKSSFDGYLYVTNYGSSGNYSLLFPREETGRQNMVQSGKEYVVPATQTHFRISGPPGFESIYWLVSPVALGNPMDLTPARPSNYHPPSMLPRCDGAAMRARGLCLDAKAGPRAVEEQDKLPDNLEPMRSSASRELTIVQQRNQSVLSASSASAAPLLYEFRLAHK